jgi:hypothetical protein
MEGSRSCSHGGWEWSRIAQSRLLGKALRSEGSDADPSRDERA